MTWKALAMAVALIAATPAQSTKRTPPSDWPAYNRDFASTRYSPLTQITPSNVAKLPVAWSYKMRAEPNSPPSGAMNEGTPMVVNGVAYLPAGNKVLAPDPDTGKEIWRYDLRSAARNRILARR